MAKKVKRTKKVAKKATKKSAAKSVVKPQNVKVPAVVGKIYTIAGKLHSINELPDNLVTQRDRLEKSINNFAARVQKSHLDALKGVERARAKVKRQAEKVRDMKIKDAAKAKLATKRAGIKAKRDAAKAKRTEAANMRKIGRIAVLRAQIEKLEAKS